MNAAERRVLLDALYGADHTTIPEPWSDEDDACKALAERGFFRSYCVFMFNRMINHYTLTQAGINAAWGLE